MSLYRVVLGNNEQGFPNGVDFWGGQFGQNGQKLHEIYKINIFFGKIVEGNGWEHKPIFWVVGWIPPVCPTRENPIERRNFQYKLLLNKYKHMLH